MHHQPGHPAERPRGGHLRSIIGGLAESNLTVLNGTQGVNEVVAGLVGRGLTILDTLKKSVPVTGHGVTGTVLAGQVPGEVLAAATRSLNVTLYRPEAPAGDEPGLDQVIETARRFYPASLAEENTVLAQ